MRRKTVKALATLGRATALTICVAAGATALLWSQGAAVLRDWDRDASDRPLSAARARLAVAASHVDAGARRLALAQLHNDLRDIRSMERLAPVAVQCREHLANCFELAFDHDAAAGLWREAIDFDANDLHAMARLAELQCRRPDTTAAGLQSLTQLIAMAPNAPCIVQSLVRALLALGRPEHALLALQASRASATVGTFVIAVGGEAATVSAMPCSNVGTNGALRLVFALPPTVHSLRLGWPVFAAFRLQTPLLRLSVPNEDIVVSLCERPGTMNGVVVDPDGIEALGHAAAWLNISLPARTDTMQCVITAGIVPRPSPAMAMTALDPVFAAWAAQPDAAIDVASRQQLAEWRAAALRGMRLGLRLGQGDALMARIECHPDNTFSATWMIERDASELQFEWPGERACHPWRTIELVAAGRTVTLDPRTVSLLATHAVQQSPLGLIVTGESPSVRIACPTGDRLTSLTVRGIL